MSELGKRRYEQGFVGQQKFVSESAMVTPSIISNPPGWLIAAGSALGTAVLGAVAAIWVSYSDFRGKRLEQNSVAIETTIQSENDLRKALERFIQATNDKASLTEDDRARLGQVARQAFEKAEDARNRLGSLDGEFDTLAKSLVMLKDAGEKVSNSLDGKQFVTAYAKWIVADGIWRKEVQKRQNSYWASLRF